MIAGDPAGDFFEQNPELKQVSAFKKLIKGYGQKKAGKIAWAVYMVESPDSTLFSIPRDERIAEVRTNYNVDVEKYDDFRKDFVRYVIPKEERLFKIHMEKLDEMTEHLTTLDLNEDKDFKKYVSLMDKLPKIYSALDKVKKDMIDKKSKNVVFGGAKRSAREKRW